MMANKLQRPLGSYLLRVYDVEVRRLVRHYELRDLAGGTALQFASLAALHRHLRQQEVAAPGGMEPTAEAAPAGPATAQPGPPQRRRAPRTARPAKPDAAK